VEGAHILPAHACFGSQPCGNSYANLWHTTIKRRQTDINATFYSYLQFIMKVVETTLRIPEEVFIAYKDVARFRADMHHLYVQGKKDPVRQELSTSYRLTLEDVHLLISDWEDEWKNLADKPGSSQEYKDQEKRDEEEDRKNGVDKHPSQSKIPEAEHKRKDKDPEQTRGARKKDKSQWQAPFYILTDDDMDWIEYPICNSTKELWGEAATKHEDQQKKVLD
jgi:hypothetical protein